MDENKESLFPKSFPIPPDSVSEVKLAEILNRELINWRIVQSLLPEDPFIKRKELFREFKFENFDKVIEFISTVGVACNIYPHHPRWENTWTTLKVWLCTWDSKHIISYKDIMLARHMERVFADFKPIMEEPNMEGRINAEQNNFVRKMKKLIGQDDLEEVFNLVSIYTVMNSEKRINNSLILLNRRYQRTRRAERDDIQPREVINLELSKISNDLLEILSELANDKD